jgi:two-component sensor histidine kinase
MTWSDWLVYPVNLTPHGYCLLWAPGLIWLHAISDAVIALAYFSIPLALIVFVQQRKDLEFKWVFLLFVGFIMACGLSHVMAVYTLWVAAYGLEGIIKVMTALLSVATALLLWPLIPKLLALPSPAQLAAVNADLEEKIREKDELVALLRASEEEVLKVNAALEERVAARTEDLLEAMRELEGTKDTLEVMVAERTEALKQRDLLLREVYHRVKNNLQIVDALVHMQAGEIEDPAVKASLEGLRSRIYALGLVHQQLMTSSDLKTFDLAPFLEELSENLASLSPTGEIRLIVDAMPLSVDLDYALPLGLIVTELVTNAIKHAFPDGHGNVTIRVSRGGERHGQSEIVVTVSDDGMGQKGTDAAGTVKGLGKRLINGLLAQLKGRMVTEGGAGSTIHLHLPEPKLT